MRLNNEEIMRSTHAQKVTISKKAFWNAVQGEVFWYN